MSTHRTAITIPGSPEAVGRQVRNELADMLHHLAQAQTQIAAMLRDANPQEGQDFASCVLRLRSRLGSVHEGMTRLHSLKD